VASRLILITPPISARGTVSVFVSTKMGLSLSAQFTPCQTVLTQKFLQARPSGKFFHACPGGYNKNVPLDRTGKPAERKNQ
jgi:hypothetical protein